MYNDMEESYSINVEYVRNMNRCMHVCMWFGNLACIVIVLNRIDGGDACMSCSQAHFLMPKIVADMGHDYELIHQSAFIPIE